MFKTAHFNILLTDKVFPEKRNNIASGSGVSVRYCCRVVTVAYSVAQDVRQRPEGRHYRWQVNPVFGRVIREEEVMSQYVENYLEIGERRRHKRIPVAPQTFIKLGKHGAGIILNISEGGLALTSVEILSADHLTSMQFQLPGSQEWIETIGEIAWSSKSRTEAGIRFVNLPKDTRKKIRKWISQKPPRPFFQGRITFC